MISELARGDCDDLKAEGLSPTLDDFDRLNCLALRLTDGAESTAANFPRVGWAGDIPFYQPTYQAFAWYLTYADRLVDTADKDAAWFYALAHCRIRGAFDALVETSAIRDEVNRWLAALPVTGEEVRRACRYASSGFDDAEAGRSDAEKMETDEERTKKNLDGLHARLLAAAAVSGLSPADLELQTPSSLKEIERVARERNGEKLGLDKSSLMRDYDLARSEIRRRLLSERANDGNGSVADGANGRRDPVDDQRGDHAGLKDG